MQLPPIPLSDRITKGRAEQVLRLKYYQADVHEGLELSRARRGHFPLSTPIYISNTETKLAQESLNFILILR